MDNIEQDAVKDLSGSEGQGSEQGGQSNGIDKSIDQGTYLNSFHHIPL